MSLATFLESIPADSDTAAFVGSLDRLHVLAAQQFERGLYPEELEELVSIRQQLRNHLARWLEKR